MERQEFDRLLTASYRRIMGMARGYAGRFDMLHAWQDIAQTALLRMLSYADLYDPRRGEFMPWACVVIINTIKTRINQVTKAPDMTEFNSFILETIPGKCDPESDLQSAFIHEYLNEEARLYVEGYSYAEIAARCGFRSKGTTKTRIDNCADRLSRVLGIKDPRKRRAKTYAVGRKQKRIA